MSVLLAIGTGKGLFLARSEDACKSWEARKSWEISGPRYPMTGCTG